MNNHQTDLQNLQRVQAT